MNDTSTPSFQESLVKSWDNHKDIGLLSFKLNAAGQAVGLTQDGDLLAGEQWLNSIPMMQSRNLIGRNISRGLLVPKVHSSVEEQSEFLSTLFDWNIEHRNANGLVGPLADQKLNFYLIERIIGQASIYADLISDELPNTDSPFHFLVEIVPESEIWLPLYCSSPMGIVSVDLAINLLKQLEFLHKGEIDGKSAAVWLPKNKGCYLTFKTVGAVETVPPKISNDVNHKYELTNESCKIPVQLVRKTNELNIGIREAKERIYCFTDDYQNRSTGEESVLPIPPGILLLADLHMSEKRVFNYQCTKREYGGITYRNHYFRETIDGSEKFVSDVEDLLVEKIYELPSVFKKEGFNVFLESDCSFYPNIENFDSAAVRKFLNTFLEHGDEKKAVDLKSSINLFKLSKNNPIERIVLQEERWQSLEKVIDPIIKGLSPDLYRDASETLLVREAADKLQESGKVYIQFLEETVLKELQKKSKQVFGVITDLLKKIDSDLDAIQIYSNDVAKLRQESNSEISKFLSSDWDSFYQKIYQFHTLTLEKVKRWELDNLSLIGQKNNILNAVKSKVQDSKGAVNSAVKELKELTSTLEKNTTELEDLAAKAGQLRNESEKIWIESQKRKVDADNDLKKFQIDSEAFMQKAKINSKHIDSANEKVLKLQKSVNKKIDQLNKEYGELSEKKQGLISDQAHCKSLIKEVEQQKRQIELEKKALNKLESEYQSKNHPKVKVDLAAIQNQVSNKEKLIANANKQINEIEMQKIKHEDLVSELKTLTKKEEALRRELKGNNDVVELRREVDRLKESTGLMEELQSWRVELQQVCELSDLTNEEISATKEIYRRVNPLIEKFRTSPFKRQIKLFFKPVDDLLARFKRSK